jgi:hypothetical protein
MSISGASGKIRYLRCVKFISSWKVLVALLVPSVLVDYFLFDGRVEFFFWFLIAYAFFIAPLSFSFYFRGGAKRLAALESGDTQLIEKQQAHENKRYIAILIAIALVALYAYATGTLR